MSKKLNTRALAAKLSWQIVDKGKSSDGVLRQSLANTSLSEQDKGLVQELCYGVCRWYGDLDEVATALLAKPIRNKDRIVHFILLVGLYQLRHLATPSHAAVDETVKACRQLDKVWAKNLVNGCLREYLRQHKGQDGASPSASNQGSQIQFGDAHPSWIVQEIRSAWPDYADQIITANNQRPPMCLRVNSSQISRDRYLESLSELGIDASRDPYSVDGIILNKPTNVGMLPSFDAGAVSVQDTAAQLACDILQIEPGQTVLDACAAPGGKTAHILERANSLAETTSAVQMHAMDISERRCIQLRQTLERIGLSADIIVADASLNPNNAWRPPASGYDRILIDAPCSGLGVIRRHPDIKHHRRPTDIEQLNQIQSKLMANLWPKLKPGGLLLYMTCSILPLENDQQIASFLETQSDAQLEDFHHPNALNLAHGKQTLPGVHAMDGFYYCLLRKLKP